MIDPQETPSEDTARDALCGACGGLLPPTRYVHVEAWAIDLLCSAACYRDVARARRRVRWSARYRLMLRTAVTAVLVGAFLAPHRAPAGRRRVARTIPARRPAPPSGAA